MKNNPYLNMIAEIRKEIRQRGVVPTEGGEANRAFITPEGTFARMEHIIELEPIYRDRFSICSMPVLSPEIDSNYQPGFYLLTEISRNNIEWRWTLYFLDTDGNLNFVMSTQVAEAWAGSVYNDIRQISNSNRGVIEARRLELEVLLAANKLKYNRLQAELHTVISRLQALNLNLRK